MFQCPVDIWVIEQHAVMVCATVRSPTTVYPKKYAHGFVVLCFVVVMQSFIMNLHEVFIHIHQAGFAGTGAIVRLPLCQWSKPDGYGKISQCITTTKHSKAKTVCIFLGIYCMCLYRAVLWLIISHSGGTSQKHSSFTFLTSICLAEHILLNFRGLFYLVEPAPR